MLNASQFPCIQYWTKVADWMSMELPYVCCSICKFHTYVCSMTYVKHVVYLNRIWLNLGLGAQTTTPAALPFIQRLNPGSVLGFSRKQHHMRILHNPYALYQVTSMPESDNNFQRDSQDSRSTPSSRLACPRSPPISLSPVMIPHLWYNS